MKLNTKLLTITALFIAALMLLSPISQTNTSGGGGTNNYDLDFLNSLDINNNNFVLSADSSSNSVNIKDVKVVDKEDGTKELQYDGKEVDTTTFISISDVAGLKKLSDLVNDDDESNKDDDNDYGFDFSGYTIKLTENLILDDPDQAGQPNFTPIGKDIGNTKPENNYPYQFNGTFDGQGHTISNLKIYRSGAGDKYAGLFGFLGDKSIVKNLGIINSEISATSTSDDFAISGGIAGWNSGTIENCYNTGVVKANGDADSGGIAGRTKGGTITNCYNTGAVSGTGNNSGGIVGTNYGETITNCYNSGAVSGPEDYSGGIAGYSGTLDDESMGTITNCYNTGTVNGFRSGGIAGKNDQGVTIENCYNTGDVNANSTNYEAYSGGIVGENYGTITNCYNSGDVTATVTVTSTDDSENYYAHSGGVAGKNEGTIENCYDTGVVTGTVTVTNVTSTNYNANSGGIAGYNSGTIENCYYLKGCVSGSTNDKGTELASDDMKGLKLLGGDGSNHDLNKEQNSKPWSPDIFGVNNGYPILADVPTQDPNSANKPPQSAVYVTLGSENNQAENYLKPFIGTNGNEVTATVNYLINPDKDITSYQWYTMNDKGVFIEVNETSLPEIQETYYVKVTIDGYSYTSLTRTVSDSFIVMFDNDGGSGVNGSIVSKNKAIAEPEDPTKTGYTFEEWYSDETLNTPYNFEDEVTKNTTLYAKWKEIEYGVVYDGNNNTSGTVPTDNEKYTIGNPINVKLNEGNLAKSGHIFRGWNYTPNASSGLSSPITLTKDVIENYINTVSDDNTTLTLYAVWTPIPEPIYTLCLNSNDSTLQTKRYSGTYGTEVTLKSASDFGWNNECKFIEWNSKSDGSGISYKEGDKFSLGSEVWNLYAIWSDSSYHTVSFDSNGGSNVPSQSVQDGYRASEPNAPTKQGHSFKYWSLNGTKYDFNQSVKEDITLKAEYEVISYKVTFYYNGDVYYSTQVDYNTSLGDRMPSLPSDKDKWNTSENGKGSNFNADSLITSDISVYAVSENSITSILIIGGSAAAILAAIAAWMFMRSRYN